MATLAGSGMAFKSGLAPTGVVLLKVSFHFAAQSSVWGVLGEVADFAAGNYGKTIGQRIQGAFIDQFTKKMPKPVRDRIGDAANDAAKSSRCAR
jgi:hypothetical protein